METLKIFADIIEPEAVNQVYSMAKSEAYKNNIIRMMPDCHAGKGCTVGTTMLITDKGHVEYKNLYLPNTDIEEVIKTVNLINKMIAGTPINEISEKLEYNVKPIIANYVKQHEV